MKEITRIHLAKVPYEIEIDAKKVLQKYLDELKKYSADEDIFSDVEIRITEILSENKIITGGIITLEDVQKIKKQIGDPSVFCEDDDRLLENNSKVKKKLYRDTQNKIITGVASGIAEYFEVDAIIVRMAFILACFLSFGIGILVYIILSLIIPRAKNASEILNLRGRKITANNIKEVNAEYDFEKISRSSENFKKVICYFLGVVSLLIALGGISLIYIGNIGLNQAFTVPVEVDEASKIAIRILTNISGITFVLFFLALAISFFLIKLGKARLILLIASFIISVTSFTSGIYIAISRAYSVRGDILANEKVVDLNIDKQKLSQIKNIKVDGDIKVNYSVAKNKEVSAKFHQFDKIKTAIKKEDIKAEIVEDTLKISTTKAKVYGWGVEQNIDIAGPEIEKITLNNTRFDYYGVSQPKLEIVQKSSSLKVLGDITIDELKIIQENESNINANGVIANKLIARSDIGRIELFKANNVEFETFNCRNRQGYHSYAELSLEKGKPAKILLNGKDFNEERRGECFMLDIDEDRRI